MTNSVEQQLQLLELIAAQNTQATSTLATALQALEDDSIAKRASLKTELEGIINTKTDTLTAANTTLNNLLTSFEAATEGELASVNDLITQNANIISANQSLITQLQNTDTVTNDTIAALQAKDTELENSIASLNTNLTNAINAVDAKVDQEILDRAAAVSALTDTVVANKAAADASFAAVESRATAIETDLNSGTLLNLKNSYNTGVQSIDSDGVKTISIAGVDYSFNFLIN